MNLKTNSKISVRTIAFLGILIALDLVVSRLLSIDTQFLKINASFLTHSLIGTLFSPVITGVTFGLMDIIGFMLKPTGPFFPGFTLSAVIIGVLYALFYYRQEITLKRVVFANVTITLLDSLVLTPIWLTLMYHVPFWTLMPVRFVKALIMIPIQIIIVYLVLPRILEVSILKRLRDK